MVYKARAESRYDGSGYFVADDDFNVRKLATYQALYQGRGFQPILTFRSRSRGTITIPRR